MQSSLTWNCRYVKAFSDLFKGAEDISQIAPEFSLMDDINWLTSLDGILNRINDDHVP